MDFKTTLLVLLFVVPLLAGVETYLNFFEYCSYYNYPVEDHIIPTQDHYNLQFYRLQGKIQLIKQRTLILLKVKK